MLNRKCLLNLTKSEILLLITPESEEVKMTGLKTTLTKIVNQKSSRILSPNNYDIFKIDL
jgi:hypothetical protein